MKGNHEIQTTIPRDRDQEPRHHSHPEIHDDMEELGQGRRRLRRENGRPSPSFGQVQHSINEGTMSAIDEAKALIFTAMQVYNLEPCRKWLEKHYPEYLKEMEKK